MNTKSICRCAMFCALITIGAYIKIPLSLCPVTMQLMFVILSGLILDKKLAVLSNTIYMIAGLIGIPVFAGGGGIGYVLNPTFGYIIAFIFGSLVTSCIAKKDFSLKNQLIAAYIGMAVIYVIGTAYFYIICNYVTSSPVGIAAVMLSCVFITLPADAVSCFFAAMLSCKLRKHLTD